MDDFVCTAIPLIVAGGGGGIGIAHSIDEKIQHGSGYEIGQADLSGHRQVDVNGTGGAGGGWRSEADMLESIDGASLLQGGRGGEACYSKGMQNIKLTKFPNARICKRFIVLSIT